jgi:hypothetical protein
MAGYSSRPLTGKLGLRDGMRALLVDIPVSLTEISGYAGFSAIDVVLPNQELRDYDFIHIFATDRSDLLASAPRIVSALKPDGMAWISWPKKASKIPTTISEDALRAIFLPTGLVDVKVAAIAETWSGLKFVFRKEFRARL